MVIALELELLGSEVLNASQVQKYPGCSECSVLPFTTVIIKSCLFKVVKIFICKRIGTKNSVSWLLIVYQLCEKGPKCNSESIIPIEIKETSYFLRFNILQIFLYSNCGKKKEIQTPFILLYNYNILLNPDRH